MEENEKKQIINEAHETIDKVSDVLNINGSKSKDFINKLDESDLKVIKELEILINMFKKPFWKVVLAITIVCSIINALYILGTFIGSFIANLGL